MSSEREQRGDPSSSEDRFRTLPKRIPLDEMIEEVETDPARDPDFGRNPDRDWMLRGV